MKRMLLAASVLLVPTTTVLADTDAPMTIERREMDSRGAASQAYRVSQLFSDLAYKAQQIADYGRDRQMARVADIANDLASDVMNRVYYPLNSGRFQDAQYAMRQISADANDLDYALNQIQRMPRDLENLVYEARQEFGQLEDAMRRNGSDYPGGDYPGGGYPGGGYPGSDGAFHAECTAQAVDHYGRVVGTYYGQGAAGDRQNAVERAKREAMIECQSASRGYGQCSVRTCNTAGSTYPIPRG